VAGWFRGGGRGGRDDMLVVVGVLLFVLLLLPRRGGGLGLCDARGGIGGAECGFDGGLFSLYCGSCEAARLCLVCRAAGGVGWACLRVCLEVERRGSWWWCFELCLEMVWKVL
jgi:hypothetical protein